MNIYLQQQSVKLRIGFLLKSFQRVDSAFEDVGRLFGDAHNPEPLVKRWVVRDTCNISVFLSAQCSLSGQLLAKMFYQFSLQGSNFLPGKLCKEV